MKSEIVRLCLPNRFVNVFLKPQWLVYDPCQELGFPVVQSFGNWLEEFAVSQGVHICLGRRRRIPQEKDVDRLLDHQIISIGSGSRSLVE